MVVLILEKFRLFWNQPNPNGRGAKGGGIWVNPSATAAAADTGTRLLRDFGDIAVTVSQSLLLGELHVDSTSQGNQV